MPPKLPYKTVGTSVTIAKPLHDQMQEVTEYGGPSVSRQINDLLFMHMDEIGMFTSEDKKKAIKGMFKGPLKKLFYEVLDEIMEEL